MRKDIRRKKLKSGEIIPLAVDFVFGSIFNKKENIGILENFIAMYLEIPLEEVRGNLILQQRKLPLDNKKEKTKEVDVVLDYNGEYINIELNTTFGARTKERNVVFASFLHGKQLRYADNDYRNIKQTLQINLNNTKGEKIIERKMLYDIEKKEVYSDGIIIDIVNLQNDETTCYTKREKELYKWSRIFLASTEEKLDSSLSEVEMEEITKEQLKEQLEHIAAEEENFFLYEKYDKNTMTLNSAIADRDEAFEERDKAFAKLAEAKEEVVKNLNNMGLALEKIAEAVNLPLDQVKEILEKDYI